ncbi:uncharacterized protein LOC142591412 [Dermacentor variabilis]|uniref:uncharacterized protein LOC142591412 n=1 Tax=Dermacentor variabilis TaxID=34621 RepID=UPI003F5B6CA4
MGKECDFIGGGAICSGKKRTQCNEEEEAKCKAMKRQCEFVDGAPLCIVKKRTKCNEEETKVCKELGKSCDLSTGEPQCTECPIDACWTACQEAEPNRTVLTVTCSASDMCSCSYEDECLASKCEDYCKVAVPEADPKKATCKDNVCYCAKPHGPQEPTTTAPLV